MQVTFETKAWITDTSPLAPDEIQTPEGAAKLFFTAHDMSRSGWTLAGSATVSIELVGMAELIDNKVFALREQAANIRAEATAKCTKIEGQIQQLLCIENSAGAT